MPFFDPVLNRLPEFHIIAKLARWLCESPGLQELIRLSIYKTVLPNGLTVIIKEMHHAPVACLMVWYRVGSRLERPGITGVSHWVEHMMFRGTEAFPPGVMDRAIARVGGYNNAFTWLDFTAYYELLPTAELQLALDIEADRMRHVRMLPEEVEAERTVIIAERGMYENDPRFVLEEELINMAFRVHSYHHEIIGDLADLQTMTRDDLYGYYQQHYVPSNGIVVLVGDVETAVSLQQIIATFGPLPPGEPVTAVPRPEPPQRGERRLVINGSDQTAHLMIAYRAPAADSADYFPLVLLNAALTGGGSLGMFSGGGSNKSSRLYKALVDTELAMAVSGSLTPTIDPFLYQISAVVRAGQSVQAVETAVDQALAELTSHPITQAELDKALKQAKAEFVMAGESISGQAQLLGMAEAVLGDYGWFETVVERLAAVTLADVQRVQAHYLRPSQRTVGWYVPE